jgi:hypothetical protein
VVENCAGNGDEGAGSVTFWAGTTAYLQTAIKFNYIDRQRDSSVKLDKTVTAQYWLGELH